MEAEIRRLIEFLAADGRYGNFPIDDDSANNKKSPPSNNNNDDDIPPRQKGLWD
jgi:hypothetical protein